MIDKKGRLFGLVSVIDLLVLAGVAVLVVFGMLQLGGGTGIGIMDTPQRVSVRFDTAANLEWFTAERISVGDPVWDHFTEMPFGQVTQFQVLPGMEYHPNAAGILVSSRLPDFYHLEITTEFEAFPVQNGLWVNGHTFAVGETVVIRVGDTNVFSMIADMTFLD